ncbi:MAG: hypothetical protein M3441_16415 [Chloroflexota bacterium]|nr:hypothetical protein [Chloroflexota bacterium]
MGRITSRGKENVPTEWDREKDAPVQYGSTSSKGPFFAWSGDGTGPYTLLQTLQTQYSILSAEYNAKGRQYEARLFARIVKEYERIEQKFGDMGAGSEEVG